MNEILIEKYFNNRCTDEELKQVLDWFENSGDTPDCRDLLWRIWNKSELNDSCSETDFESILDKIHHKVNLNNTVTMPQRDDNDFIRHSGRSIFMRNLRNAAAILLIPVLGLSLFYSVKYYSVRNDRSSMVSSYNEVYSSVDAITKVLLPDGTNVWLNHSSTLRYPASFNGESRKVELKGEGFFEVAHNPESPFIVNAGGIDVIALGTTFNVMAYPEENKVETSLIEGRVELQRYEGREKITLCQMKPADMTVYYKEKGELLTRTIKDDRYFSWKEGKLVFTADPLTEVAKKLSRWFNAEIDIKDPKVEELTLTATFVNESLAQVLELLTMVSPVNYTMSEKKMNPDGTFARRQVSLTYRIK